MLALALLAGITGGLRAEETSLDEPINLIPPDEPPPAAAAVEEIQASQPDPEPLEPLKEFSVEGPDEIAADRLIPESVEAVDAVDADSVSDAATESGADGIAVDALGGIDPDAAGLLNEGPDGLPATLWQGADRALVARLLPRLARAAPSQTMRALALRLLLSAGPAPVGDGDGAPGDLLRLRVRTLADMGEYDVAAALLDAPPGFEDPALGARLDAARLFRDLDFPGACSLAREQIGQTPNVYWRKAVIFCQALEGDIEAALVGADLMSEGGEPPGPGFFAAIHTMAGGEPPALESVGEAGPFQMAMLRAAGMRAPEGLVETANPAVLRIIAASSETGAVVRLLAAERAERLGALPAESVAGLYAGVAFGEEHAADPLAAAEVLEPPLARALLYQVVAAQRVPVARGEAMSAALSMAAGHGELGIMARTLLPEILAIEPQPLFGWFAAPATRGLIAAGNTEGALAWYVLALRQVAVGPEAAAVAIDLWPLMQLADPEQPLDETMLNAWWEQQGGAASPDAHVRAGKLMSLLAALGHDVPGHFWHALLAGPSATAAMVPSPAITNLLDDAVAGGRIGEVVLLGLIALGEAGPAAAGVPTVARVVRAFHLVGLDAEARALALETALAEGF